MDEIVVYNRNRWHHNSLFVHRKTFRSLGRVDFSLHGAGSEISNDEKFASFLVAKTDSTITFKSHAEGFSTLKEGTVLKWAGINKIIPDDGHFGSINVDLDNPLHAEVIQHALVDLMYKNELYGPITKCAEASVREYISAAILALKLRGM
jgi:hypothetical protein